NATPEELLEARVELHQRLALPFACIVLTFAGGALGLSSRRRGKSPAVVLTVALAFLYYMTLIGVIGLAPQKSLPVELAMWTPNILVAMLGTFLLVRLERPGTRDIVEVVTGWFRRPTFADKRYRMPRFELRR